MTYWKDFNKTACKHDIPKHYIYLRKAIQSLYLMYYIFIIFLLNLSVMFSLFNVCLNKS